MTPETKTCQNCKSPFVIEPEDFAFYEKMQVPPPTFCPQCRMQRRFTWRNERTLFRNTCRATNKPIISGFHPDSGVTVYERDYWWSDAWDALSYGAEYDFSRPFFAQWKELFLRAPMPSVFNARTVNTLYGNHIGEYKDAYMVSASWEGENVCYAARANSTKDSADVFALVGCNLCYESVASEKLYNARFLDECENCTDSWLSFDCRGCSNVFGCTSLRNKSYYIFNQPYSKEDYFKKLKEMNPGSFSGLETAKKIYEPLRARALRKYAAIINCQNVTGDRVYNASNCHEIFDMFGGIKDCKYVMNGGLQFSDSYDGYGVGAQCELQYEAIDAGVQGMKQYFVGMVYGGANIWYSLNCHGCNNLFGCIGLRNKEYCIFNKQYSKEEFEVLQEKIIAQMTSMPYTDAAGREYRFGEFFPTEISPYAYNETVAQEYLPYTAEDAKRNGFLWREREKTPHFITKQANELEDDIKNVKDDVINEVIACAGCGGAYRIIAQELNLLRQMGVPLPRRCPECRHQRRFKSVNLPKLYRRTCTCAGGSSMHGDRKNVVAHFHGDAHCPNEFETSYAPDRPEIVYCEQCYQAEVA